MKYTTVNVQQLTNRKGKPWQARAKYKDVYGKWKEVMTLLNLNVDGLQHGTATYIRQGFITEQFLR